jgi:hypothetical protein
VPVQNDDRLGGSRPRTPRAVIDQALSDNAHSEWLIWGLCLGLFLLMVAVVVAGFVRETWLGATAAVPGALFGLVFRHAWRLRDQKIALRMLEVVLNNVTTAEEAKAAISEAYGYTFDVKGGKSHVVPKTGQS